MKNKISAAIITIVSLTAQQAHATDNRHNNNMARADVTANFVIEAPTLEYKCSMEPVSVQLTTSDLSKGVDFEGRYSIGKTILVPVTCENIPKNTVLSLSMDSYDTETPSASHPENGLMRGLVVFKDTTIKASGIDLNISINHNNLIYFNAIGTADEKSFKSFKEFTAKTKFDVPFQAGFEVTNYKEVITQMQQKSLSSLNVAVKINATLHSREIESK